MMRQLAWMALGLFAGCGADKGEDSATPDAVEPLVVPDDPAARGVAVGVQTFTQGDVTFDVWYPAPDATEGQPTEGVDLQQFVPESVTAVLGEIPWEGWDSGAVRDAPVRNGPDPYPVLVFSHGFGGMRYQSTDLTVHLASRGYVVVAADHAGRMLGDILPCLFTPALAGCDLSGFGNDPAPADIAVVMDWLEDDAGPLAGHLDLDRMGLFGHSAGANSTVTVGNADGRFDLLLPMSSGGAVTRDVPAVFLDGTCDGVVPVASTTASAAASVDASLFHVVGAGHLAFSDLCQLDLGGLAQTLLAPRDDVNALLLEQMVGLGTDGCPGFAPTVDREECADAWLPLDESGPDIRHLLTVAFDAGLRGTGPGLDGLSLPTVQVGERR